MKVLIVVRLEKKSFLSRAVVHCIRKQFEYLMTLLLVVFLSTASANTLQLH